MSGDTHPVFRAYKESQAREQERRLRKQSSHEINQRILRHTAPPWGATPRPEVIPAPPPQRLPARTLTLKQRPERDTPAEAVVPAEPVMLPTSAPAAEEAEIVAMREELEERERYLRRARAILDSQQRAVQEQEMLLAMREKYLAEKAELISSREKTLIDRLRVFQEQAAAAAAARAAAAGGDPAQAEAAAAAAMQSVGSQGTSTGQLSEAEMNSFNRMREELDKREQQLNDREALLREREQFIEESETTLFEKAQELQEREEELASLRDELAQRKRKLDERDGIVEAKVKM